MSTEVRAPNWVRIDSDFRIVDCGSLFPAIKQHAGESLWDVYPGAEERFRHHYERAFRDGVASATVHYAGSIVQVRVIRESPDCIIVDLERVCLSGLAETLKNMNLMGMTKQAIMECLHEDCGLGCAVQPVPEPGTHEWPTCCFCDGNLSVSEIVQIDHQMIEDKVQRVKEMYGDEGLAELAWTALAGMHV